jgi:Phytanoyl-CoA dioxygenase (PhyH)
MQAQKEAFLENGFSTLPRLVDDSELEWLRNVYDTLFENYRNTDPGDFYDISGDGSGVARLPQIVRPEKYAPELTESAHFVRCRALAADFLDVPEADLEFYGHAILKPPRYGAPTPWHQDEAYMSPEWHRDGLSVWTPLDEATAESGCLHFVPGVQHGPVLPHRHIDHDDRVRGLMTDEIAEGAGVACPLQPGAASVHGFRTPHYAGPNGTGQPRRALVWVFMGPATRVADPESRPWRTED